MREIKKAIRFLPVLAGVLMTLPAVPVSAQDAESPESDEGKITRNGATVSGVGLEVGDNGSGDINAGLTVRSLYLTKSDDTYAALGSGGSQIRIGRGIGLSGNSNVGSNWTAVLDQNEEGGLRVLPLVGTHSMAMDFEWNSNDDAVRQDFIEWMPHVSGGALFRIKELCGVAARAKYGASIGTLGDENGAGRLVGGALEVDCGGGVGLAIDHSNIRRKQVESDLTRGDLVLPLGKKASVGIYAARIATDRMDGNDESVTSALEGSPRVERRIGFQVGGAF